MGFRFRTSIRIAKGVRLNFGKRGASLSMGGLNFSGRGVTSGFSIPGTGISYRAPLISAPSSRQGSRGSRQAVQASNHAGRALQKLEALQERAAALANTTVSLKEDGSVILTDANGDELSSSEVRMAWEQQGDTLTQWLLNEAKRIEDNELISSIHLDTPNPLEERPFKLLPFSEPAPVPPLHTEFRGVRPQPAQVAPLGFFSRLSRSRRDAHAAEAAAQEEGHRLAMEVWQAARHKHDEEQSERFAAYRVARNAWEERKQNHEEWGRKLAHDYLTLVRNDVDVMAYLLEQALERLAWPRETEVRIGFADEGQTVVLDVDLPEIEDLPRLRASIAQNGRRLLIKEKSETTLRQEYASHVHGIALRITGLTFATLPRCERVLISGYSQRIDKSTGHIRDEYLYSAIIRRDKFLHLNFADLRSVDPVAFLDQSQLRRNMTTRGIFRAIDPFTVYPDDHS